MVFVVVQTEVASIASNETVWNEREVVDGAIWFRSFGNVEGGGGVSVGLRVEIVQRMKCEQERAGWLGGEDNQARVKRVEEFGGVGDWRKFKKCYVLVESEGKMVFVVVQTEVASIASNETVWNEREVVDGAIWFRSFGNVEGGGGVSVGLRVEIVQRMKCEQERAGWLGGEDNQARVKRVEEFGGVGDWRKFKKCYVLVERFVLKRMDGSLVMTYDFKHSIRSKANGNEIMCYLGFIDISSGVFVFSDEFTFS
ncbi:unnamed protein product [Ilex paraguariensis]|uniref:Uncharacterized protein n=1 Tax=Ilex paraguariensis TaxID=185542 RepID=A0ABC8SJH3_9AQUA